MDKQIIKNIIIEKQVAIPNYKLVHRDFLFGDKSNYVLVGLRRAGKSYLLYQDIQTRLNKGEQSAQDILYINFEDERLSYRVMITGSNAKMLGKEMYSTLGGRYIPKEIFPFSFAEYLIYHQVEPCENWEYNQQVKSIVSNYFDSYFYEGGIAESFEQPDKREYLNALYQKILIGDIVERNNIRNSRVFRFLAKKLADSVMQPSSLTRLQHMVKSTGDTISLKLLENMVAIELNRRFRNTTEETLLYYFNKNIEIDFCVPSAQLAIQVSYNLNDEATYKREVGALIKFLKAFPGYHGYIITRDYETQIEADGHTIEVVPIWKWLLQSR
ncbi:AAA family ATPase [Hallella sp.]|uniref:ATP-binding protein n=1 Tax=Hallella sp. TaxID=2980186 RepID=UPI00307AB80B